MKKVIFILLLTLVLSFTFTGCQSKTGISNNTGNTAASTVTQPAEQVSLKVQDFFPIQGNTMYEYQGTGNEYAAYTAYADYTSEDKIQLRTSNGGTEAVKVYQVTDGKVIVTFSKGEVYYRENFLSTKEGQGDIVLMEPLKTGNSWTASDGSKRTITKTEADVTTPSGKYKAIEVTTDVPDGKNIDYYVKNIGLVKSVFQSSGLEVTSALAKIDKNTSISRTVDFYYPAASGGNLHYVSETVTFKTNDVTKKVLTDAYRKIVQQLTQKPVATDIDINSLYLNKDNMVYIDLNPDFVTEINKYKTIEKQILQSVANTFGEYYGTKKVVLTIDNNLYKSESLSFKKGQYLDVNTLNAVQDKKP